MKRIFGSFTILAVALTATQTIAFAEDDDTRGIEGAWIANVTVHDCQNRNVVIRTVRSLNLFIHDGSFTEAGATVTGLVNARTSSIGVWRHVEGKTYNSTIQFIGLNPAGAFATMLRVTRTIQLDGDQWTSTETVHVFDVNGNLLNTLCSEAAATRAP